MTNTTNTATATRWEDFDESTGASWFWALLFGPLYYIAHGFWKQAVLIFFSEPDLDRHSGFAVSSLSRMA